MFQCRIIFEIINSFRYLAGHLGPGISQSQDSWQDYVISSSAKDLYSRARGSTVIWTLKKSTLMRGQLMPGPITTQNGTTPSFSGVLFKGQLRSA
jgi:hypothetical protein